MAKAALWCNKKQGVKTFLGSYERDKDGERLFVLKWAAGKKRKKVTFESHEAAKAAGWVRTES